MSKITSGDLAELVGGKKALWMHLIEQFAAEEDEEKLTFDEFIIMMLEGF